MHALTHTHRNKVSAKARKSYKDAANVDAASLPLRERARGGVAAADLLCEKAERECEEGEDKRERVGLGERA